MIPYTCLIQNIRPIVSFSISLKVFLWSSGHSVFIPLALGTQFPHILGFNWISIIVPKDFTVPIFQEKHTISMKLIYLDVFCGFILVIKSFQKESGVLKTETGTGQGWKLLES